MSFIKKITTMALFMSVLSATTTQASDTQVLRYNQWFPANHWSQVDGLLKFFEEIETVTEGRVKIVPSAKPLAPPSKNYQAVTSGIADVAWGPHGYTPGAFPLSEMLEFPFDNKDARKSSIAYWRVFNKYFAPVGMHDDVVTLAVHVTSGGNLHMKSKSVNTADDLKGVKIRVQTPAVSNAMKELGAVPISGSLVELREFLSRGVIDGTALSDELVTGFKIDRYINYVTQIPGGLYSNSAFVIMNKNKWNKISKQDQDAIMAIAGEQLSARMGQLWDENDIKGREELKQRLGEKYTVASSELIESLRAVFSPYQQQWFEVAKENGVDGKAVLEFYKTELDSIH